MKTIGLLGGMSWESTAGYYRLINEAARERLGGLHSARICLYSVDFEEIERLQHSGDWDRTAVILARAYRSQSCQTSWCSISVAAPRTRLWAARTRRRSRSSSAGT